MLRCKQPKACVPFPGMLPLWFPPMPLQNIFRSLNCILNVLKDNKNIQTDICTTFATVWMYVEREVMREKYELFRVSIKSDANSI